MSPLDRRNHPRRWRHLPIIAAAALASCSSQQAAEVGPPTQDSPPAQDSTEASPSTQATTTTSTTPPTTEASIQPLDGADSDALYRALDAFRVEARASGDRSLLETYVSDESNLERFSELEAEGTRYDGSASDYRIDAVEEWFRPSPSEIFLRVTDTMTTHGVYRDSAGNVVDNGGTRDIPTQHFFVRVELVDTTWMITDDTLVGSEIPPWLASPVRIDEQLRVNGFDVTRFAQDGGGWCFVVHLPFRVGCMSEQEWTDFRSYQGEGGVRIRDVATGHFTNNDPATDGSSIMILLSNGDGIPVVNGETAPINRFRDNVGVSVVPVTPDMHVAILQDGRVVEGDS